MKNSILLRHGASLCLMGVLLMLAVGSSDSGGGGTRAAQPKTPEEARKELIGKHFSAWDGSHDGLTKLIKSSMNDPKSYEHVETRYSDKGDHLIVGTTFRGKNAFGGVVTSTIIAKVDLSGNVIEVISQDP